MMNSRTKPPPPSDRGRLPLLFDHRLSKQFSKVGQTFIEEGDHGWTEERADGGMDDGRTTSPMRKNFGQTSDDSDVRAGRGRDGG